MVILKAKSVHVSLIIEEYSVCLLDLMVHSGILICF